MYDERTGKPVETAGGKRWERSPSQLPPCRLSVGCPKGTPEQSRELSQRNWEAWQHYRECRAVGAWPDDPIVRRNAAIILDVVEGVESLRQIELMSIGKR